MMSTHASDLRTGPALNRDSISIWRVGLEWQDSDVAAAVEILSSDEQKRASRFHRVSDRKHFIVARAGLRLILARYLKVDPGQISFEYNAFGKPRLLDGAYDPDLRFNLAHSNGAALYAFAVGREVGVDLEFIEPHFARMSLARNLFAPEEVTTLSGLSAEDFVAGFYRCWTRKEAYVKAKGVGLSLPLNSFVVSVRPDERQLLLADRFDIAEQERWMLLDVAMVEGFGATVAVQRPTRVPRRSGPHSSSPWHRRLRNDCLNSRQTAIAKAVLTITTSIGAKATNIIAESVCIFPF